MWVGKCGSGTEDGNDEKGRTPTEGRACLSRRRGGDSGAPEDPSTVAADDAIRTLAIANPDGVPLGRLHHARASLLSAACGVGQGSKGGCISTCSEYM